MARLSTVVAMSAGLAVMMLLGGCDQQPIKGRGQGAAIMLIDYQTDYLEADGRLPVAQDQVQPMIDATNAVVQAAQTSETLVFYTRDEASPFSFVSNAARNQATPRLWAGSQLDERANVHAGPAFSKDTANAFSNDKLEPWLDEQNIGQLIIGGVYADRSVLETARAALERHYKVTVISDAIASSTADSRDAALKALKDAGAEIQTSQQVIAAMEPSNLLGLRGPMTGAWWLIKSARPAGETHE